jgi:hypothetical protein
MVNAGVSGVMGPEADSAARAVVLDPDNSAVKAVVLGSDDSAAMTGTVWSMTIASIVNMM